MPIIDEYNDIETKTSIIYQAIMAAVPFIDYYFNSLDTEKSDVNTGAITISGNFFASKFLIPSIIPFVNSIYKSFTTLFREAVCVKYQLAILLLVNLFAVAAVLS